jgi:hypothetical protein
MSSRRPEASKQRDEKVDWEPRILRMDRRYCSGNERSVSRRNCAPAEAKLHILHRIENELSW